MTQTVNLPVPPRLAPFVSAIGYFQGEFQHAQERVLSTGGTQLLINLHADVLTTNAYTLVPGCFAHPAWPA